MFRVLMIFNLFLFGVLTSSATLNGSDTILLRYATIENKNLEDFIKERVIRTAQKVWPLYPDMITYDIDIQTEDSLYVFATYWGSLPEMSRGYFSKDEYKKTYVTLINDNIFLVRGAAFNLFIKPTSKKLPIVNNAIPWINEQTVLWLLRFEKEKMIDAEFDCEYSWELKDELPAELYSLPNVSIKRMPYQKIEPDSILASIRTIAAPAMIMLPRYLINGI